MNFKQKYIRPLVFLFVFVLSILSLGRLYYHLTDGFRVGNIVHATPEDSRWNSAPLTPEKKEELSQILDQEFYYLGRGCQSYVFRSRDDNYVIKFLKYQHFKVPFWLDYLTFIPFVNTYRSEKIAQKKRNLIDVFTSWKIAYEDLQSETGVIYIHLNKRKEWNKNLVIFDKLGFKHELEINSMEFMVQKKAQMLCFVLLDFKEKNDLNSAKQLIDNLFKLLITENQRGYADNDPALMQNTGVYDSMPIHIDVGQLVKNPLALRPEVFQQELFNKMWNFRLWLHKSYPELAEYTDVQLKTVIGPSFNTLVPQLEKGSNERFPSQYTN